MSDAATYLLWMESNKMALWLMYSFFRTWNSSEETHSSLKTNIQDIHWKADKWNEKIKKINQCQNKKYSINYTFKLKSILMYMYVCTYAICIIPGINMYDNWV